MTNEELIRCLEDQAQDKEHLSGDDLDSVFAHDAQALRKAVTLIKSLPPCTGPGDASIKIIDPAEWHKDAHLSECPFCGSKKIFYEKYSTGIGERWRCWCAECIACIDPGHAQRWGTVAKMWNRRALPPNPPLTLAEMQEMGGRPYWHVGLQEESPPPHWSILDPFYARHIENYGYGKRWLAYRYELTGAPTQ